MLFDSQVDEPARPCTLLVSTSGISSSPLLRQTSTVHGKPGGVEGWAARPVRTAILGLARRLEEGGIPSLGMILK